MGQAPGGLVEQDILEKIRQLEPQQITEVLDFIEFLTEKKHKESSFVRFLRDPFLLALFC